MKNCYGGLGLNWSDSKKVTELRAYLALLEIPGLGPQTLSRLVDKFGDANNALAQPAEALRGVEYIANDVVHAITTGVDFTSADKICARIHELDWRVTLDSFADYPSQLRHIPGRPPILYYRGEIRDSDITSIGVVGTRGASEDGRAFAHKLASDLAQRGVTVTSGLARGIDTSAHHGALVAGGRTIAVLGSSLDYYFPKPVKTLMDQIAENGAVVSELPPDAPPYPENFPKRNRIISGLSQGVVVIEAPEKSGALISANYALEQGRELFAVPGFPTRRVSAGCNQLLKDGAHCLTSVDDIFAVLPRLARETQSYRTRERIDLTPTEENIVRDLTSGPRQIDELARQLGLGVPDLLPTLLAMELKGVVREMSGKRFTLGEG